MSAAVADGRGEGHCVQGGGLYPSQAGWRPAQSLHTFLAQAFLLKLVQNLFAEGNDLFREKDYKQALVQYMEGLNVADYAASDQVALPRELLCKLHVNRAACYFTMGLYEKALEDSEKALGLDGESIRALFRKARALNELGRHKEAYECSSRCSLALPHDENVTQLGQELAQKLGLRVRKAYKRPQVGGIWGRLKEEG